MIQVYVQKMKPKIIFNHVNFGVTKLLGRRTKIRYTKSSELCTGDRLSDTGVCKYLVLVRAAFARVSTPVSHPFNTGITCQLKDP